MTCGCHRPTDPHGDSRNIIYDDLQAAADAAGINVRQAADNITATLATVTKSRRHLNTTYVDFLITKSEPQADGSVLVWGPCTTDDIDSDRQIIDADFASKGLSAWLASGGNIREMHQPKAIGLGMELVREGNAHWLKSRIVEPTAAKLATEKVLTAYSVGIANAKIDYAKNPKARGGTIVGGEFVEVSLVDRPANAACKIDLVKAAKDGTAEFTEILTKAADADDDEPEVDAEVQKLWTAEDTIYKKDYSAKERRRLAKEGKALPDGSYPIADTEDLHNAAILARSGHGDVAAAKRLIARRAKELGVANPLKKSDKGKVPDVDREVTEDLDRADEAVHEAQEAQHEDNEHHRESDDDDDDDDDDAEKVAAPYLVKRLHDHLCAAYSTESVVEEYPTCPTVKDAVDVAYWAKAVSTALTEDAGSGKLAGTLADLSEAYGCAVGVAHADDAAVADAREAMHKSFQGMYPSVTVKPSAVTPGRFCRPFISSGRASMHAGKKPRIPMQAHVPDASHFDRGYISSGHAANSPSAHGPNGPAAEKAAKKGRQFYTNNARDQAMEMMTNLHDYIVSMHPEICAMKADSDVAEPAPINPDNRVDNQADARPTPATTKSTEDTEVDMATVQKLIADGTKKATKKMAKAQKRLAKKYRKTSETLKALQAQADPGAMAYRGGYIGHSVTKAQTSQPVDPEEAARRDEITWLKGQVRHPDPGVSRPALAKLQSLTTDDELAEILTGGRV